MWHLMNFNDDGQILMKSYALACDFLANIFWSIDYCIGSKCMAYIKMNRILLPIISMSSFMVVLISLWHKRFLAKYTMMHFYSKMHFHVDLKVTLFGKSFLTTWYIALEQFESFMYSFNMYFKSRILSEWLFTIIINAINSHFFNMRSFVKKEIFFWLELHVAFFT